MARFLLIVMAVGALFGIVASCSAPTVPLGTSIPPRDYERFVRDVEPILVGSCAYSGCHGAENRPFRLYAPAGDRLGVNPPADELSFEEHRANFDSARTYSQATTAPLSDLLRKPLQRTAGGADHGGEDPYGNNIFPSKDDPQFKLLEGWATSSGDVGSDDAGVVDGGELPDASVTCPGCGVKYSTHIKTFVDSTEARCGGSGCHQPGTDAGCGYLVDSCGQLFATACDARPNVHACEQLRCDAGVADLLTMRRNNRLLYYACTGHQGRFSAAQADTLATWISCGAPCD